MAEGTRRFIIERRTGGAGPYMGPSRFQATPQAATGIEKTLGKSEKHADRMTQIANKVYLEARALAPALRLIPGLGPVMSGATIAAGRGFAVAVGELKTSNLGALSGIQRVLGESGALLRNIAFLTKIPSSEWRSRVYTPLISNLQGMGEGLGALAGIVLQVIPIAAVIGGGVMALFSLSKLFRSMLGNIFSILSAVLDVALLPLVPVVFMPLLQNIMGLMSWATALGNFLKTPGIFLGGLAGATVGTIAGAIIGAFMGNPLVGAVLGGLAGTFLGTFIPWLIANIGVVTTGFGIVGAIFGFLTGGPLGALIAGLLFTAVGALIEHWSEIWAWMKTVPSWLAEHTWKPIVDFFTTTVRGWVDAILAKLTALWQAFTSFSWLPWKQGGMPYVPRAMPVMVHPGEAIIPAALRPYVGMTIYNSFYLGTPQTGGGIETSVGSSLEQVLRRVFPT